MVFWGGRPEDVFLPSKVHVFLTRAGIPRIIPSFQKIKEKVLSRGGRIIISMNWCPGRLKAVLITFFFADA